MAQPLHRIIYFSPAGTTATVAERIGRYLRARGQAVESIDLAAAWKSGRTELERLEWPADCCLWIGSPVYCHHAAPPVAQFLDHLPERLTGHAVPFVTWGGVSSGLALPELAQQLLNKGLQPVGAAKIIACHSSTWNVKEPLRAGRPDGDDFALLRELVDKVCENLSAPAPVPLKLSVLNYLPERLRRDSATKSLALVKASVPLELRRELCTRCGTCMDRCPLNCISLDPYPHLGDECIRCLQCVRHCPEQAFVFDPQADYERLAALAAAAEEKKVSRVFL